MNGNKASEDDGSALARSFAELMHVIRYDGNAPRIFHDQLNLIDQLRSALDRQADQLSKSGTGFVANSFSIEQLVYESDATRILRLRHRDLGTSWALKTIAPSRGKDAVLISLLRREAEIGLHLRHPCLLETSTLLRLQDGSPGLLQPWHPVSLAAISSERDFTTEEAVALIRRILDGLKAMHDMGYVHCDVTPANIFLPDGDFHAAKLGDFGISLRFGERHNDIGLARAGSPEFAAPEQMNGHPAYPAQDLFALGKVAERLISNAGEQTNGRLAEFADTCCQPHLSSRPQSVHDALLLLDKT